MHFGRFLNKDGAGRGMSAEISSEKAKHSCSGAAASAEVSLDRQLQAWWGNPSWTDEPPEIKVSTLIAAEHFSLCNETASLTLFSAKPTESEYLKCIRTPY